MITIINGQFRISMEEALAVYEKHELPAVSTA